MVSPIKTWKHQEPKGLWPALGGLAVVAHVGVLGLSLPYLWELMEPEGSAAQSTVPIELIDVEEETPSAEIATEATAEPASEFTPLPAQTPESVETTPTASNSTVVAETGNVRSQDQSAEVSPSPRPTDSEETRVSETSETEPREEAGSAESEESEPTEPEEPEPTPSEPSTDEAASEAINESGTQNGTTESEERGIPEEAVAEPEETPAITGESALPAPESGEATNAESFAYLDIVGHSYVPLELQRDLPDTPPSPVEGAVTALTVSPFDTSCGQVDFSMRQVTYRVTVGKEGTLIGAIPWTGSMEAQPMSEGESVIACLLISANFSFNPATKEGDPVASSNLLLNINILESRQN